LQDIIDRDAEDERRDFHENNEAWGAEVREYEAVMKKQDEEILGLMKRRDERRDMS
jgi:hypothetical protein